MVRYTYVPSTALNVVVTLTAPVREVMAAPVEGFPPSMGGELNVLCRRSDARKRLAMCAAIVVVIELPAEFGSDFGQCSAELGCAGVGDEIHAAA